ncbi:MAG: DNA repair protein RadC [Calditrichaceae bacterium]|nr:DNA repair protein RadC [Calditrichaceae bacterium]MBN2707416.1 DNA repair protein RadC [Calditrichaceae bacterium]RQV96951.1 MAG: JAB domain-containing protein [Calditrichota bacterium]
MTEKIHEPDAFRSRITDWPLEERPREKLMHTGVESVSSAELIAILLGQGTAKVNAVELAKKLMRRFGSLEKLSGASLEELQEVSGIGPAKAVTLLAAFQLYRNLQKEKAKLEIKNFRNPAEVARVYQPVLGHKEQESFYVVLLNTAMNRIQDYEVTKGTLDSSLVHPREVFNKAIRSMAKGLIVLHNHPSGKLTPSEEDITITKRLVESGRILGIDVYDHIIITADGFYSFKENGLI